MSSEVVETRARGAGGREAGGGPRVVLRRRRARPLFGRHPWVFAGSIERVEGDPADGGAVVVCTHDGEFVAHGLYNSQSQIRVRLYSWRADQPPDESLWRDRLAAAIHLRRQVLGLDDPVGASRLVYSESDGMSGMVVDRYGPWLVVQLTSLALAQRLESLVALLAELWQPRGIYLRTERGVGLAEGVRLTDGPLWGAAPEGPVAIVEHGIEYEVDIRTGQKTGFYLDQRDNRLAARAYAAGRRVLDVFCYTGGFALSLARAGAAEVSGVDVSDSAIERARRNADRNGLAGIRFEAGDAFRAMESLASSGGGRYGMVILDPPKFARNARSVEEAWRGYRRANLLALNLLEPDGILVTCSCSGHISRENFLGIVASVAETARRPIQLLAQLGQAPDHPVSVACPETAYLKCFIARVGA